MTQVLLDLRLAPEAIQQLATLSGVMLHQVPLSREPVPRDPELLRQIDILIAKYPPTNFDDLTKLQLWQLGTVGFDQFGHLRLADRPLTICNARGVFDSGIAEWCLAMIVNLTRDLPGMMRDQQQCHWNRSHRYMQEVRGKTVGFWGYGGLARETARLAKAMGLKVHALTRRGVQPRFHDFTPDGTGDPEGRLPDRVFITGQEQEFLSGLDFLVVAVPKSQRTLGLIGERELRALPRSAFVLNPARGPIIDEKALLTALGEGWIAGAALDTHYLYPMPPDHPLWRFPNVIMTPHIAGADFSDRFPVLMGELAVANVQRFLSGQPLLNVVTREDLREAEVAAERYKSL
jgi:phosphoglycerate dehydrogenase-like enzyme